MTKRRYGPESGALDGGSFPTRATMTCFREERFTTTIGTLPMVWGISHPDIASASVRHVLCLGPGSTNLPSASGSALGKEPRTFAPPGKVP